MNDAGNTLLNQAPYMILKWSGCNASTVIGTLFVTTAMSFEPIASQRGVFSVQPRGSY